VRAVHPDSLIDGQFVAVLAVLPKERGPITLKTQVVVLCKSSGEVAHCGDTERKVGSGVGYQAGRTCDNEARCYRLVLQESYAQEAQV
jgi:hypothetical protein